MCYFRVHVYCVFHIHMFPPTWLWLLHAYIFMLWVPKCKRKLLRYSIPLWQDKIDVEGVVSVPNTSSLLSNQSSLFPTLKVNVHSRYIKANCDWSELTNWEVWSHPVTNQTQEITIIWLCVENIFWSTLKRKQTVGYSWSMLVGK